MSAAQDRASTEKKGQPPEVFIVLAQFEIGGTERQVLGLVKLLIQRGWRISVYCLAGNGPLRPEFEATGAVIIVPPVDADRKQRSFVARLLRIFWVSRHLLAVLLRRRPFILHVFLPAAYVLAGPLAIIARVPIRIMSRRSLNAYRESRPLIWWLEQRLHPRMTAILGNSLSVLRELHDHENVPSSKLGLIYNGVDLAPFNGRQTKLALRNKFQLAPSTLAMVIVANLIPYKGHRDLFQALGLAAHKLPDNWQLLVVGDDYGIKGELYALARNLGIETKVAFLGARDDVPDILLACDIGLLCSHEEGFSNSILEGMAAGLPMIVTSVGGNVEAILNEKTGLVVPPHSPQDLAAAIIRLANDVELRARFGAAGHARVAKKFSINESISSYEALYAGLSQKKLPQEIPEVKFSALSDIQP